MRFVSAIVCLLILSSQSIDKASAEAPLSETDSPGHMIELNAGGQSLEDARRNAVRAALQRVLKQLVLSDRVIENGDLVRDRLLTTVNGFVREFEVLEIIEREPEYLVLARIRIDEADVANYVRYLDSSTQSSFDGESVFQEMERRRMQSESLRRIMGHLLRGVPLRRFMVDVEVVRPADQGLRSPFHSVLPAEDAVDVVFTAGMDPAFGRSIHAFLESLHGARKWRCDSPERPVTLDWHDGSIAPAWAQCAHQSIGFRQQFSACTTDDGQRSLDCTTVRPELHDGEPLYQQRHRFSSSRNFGAFMFAFLDRAGRSTHRGQRCGLITGAVTESAGILRNHISGRVYPLESGELRAWQTTSAPFALATHHLVSDERKRRFLARIPVHNVNLGETETIRLGLVYARGENRFVVDLEDKEMTFAQACDHMLESIHKSSG